MKLRRYFCWLLGHNYRRICNYPFSDTGTCVYCSHRVLFTTTAEDFLKAEKILKDKLANAALSKKQEKVII